MSVFTRVALPLLLASCGRIAFDPAGQDASLAVDADSDSVPAAAVTPVVIDDFEDGVLDPIWVPYNDSNPQGTQWSETGGEMQFRLAMNVANSYAGIGAKELDIRGKALWMEVVVGPPTMTGAHCYMSWDDGVMEYQRIAADAGDTVVIIDNTQVATASLAFPATRWWRMRETGGEILFEVGPDGRAWTELYRTATPPWSATTNVNIGGGATVAVSPGGEMCRIAAVGVAPP